MINQCHFTTSIAKNKLIITIVANIRNYYVSHIKKLGELHVSNYSNMGVFLNNFNGNWRIFYVPEIFKAIAKR